MIAQDNESNSAHQSTHTTPFAAREKISRKLLQMQEEGVIRPSPSPWASPVALVRKRDMYFMSFELVNKTENNLPP